MSRSSLASVFLVAAVGCHAVGCRAGESRLGASTEHIVGGVADAADPAVVMLLAYHPGMPGAAVCTGTVVSPHVIATAGHCVAPDVIEKIIGKGYSWTVFLGDDNDDAAQAADPALFAAVEEIRFDPELSLTGRPTHDVGAVVTTDALPMAPVPVNHAALDDASIGAPLRILGYGRTKASDVKTIGAKFEAETTLASYAEEYLEMDGTPGFCDGDSGGPTLVTRNGIESLVGVHSYGDKATCDGKSFDMRADVDLAALIDPLIAEKDPDFTIPDDGSKPAAGAEGGAGGSGENAKDHAGDDGGCSVVAPTGATPSPWAWVTGVWVALSVIRRSRSSRARPFHRRRAHAHRRERFSRGAGDGEGRGRAG